MCVHVNQTKQKKKRKEQLETTRVKEKQGEKLEKKNAVKHKL